MAPIGWVWSEAASRAEAIEPLQNMFRILTRAGLNTTQAIERIQQEIPQTAEVVEVLEFIRQSKQGFVK